MCLTFPFGFFFILLFLPSLIFLFFQTMVLFLIPALARLVSCHLKYYKMSGKIGAEFRREYISG